MADITFLIVTFKSYSVIHNCLQSIPKGYPIVVVENSSDENFKKELENSYEHLECILNYENLGYAKANNIGLEKAKTKYVFLLNPDAILKKDTVQSILSAATDIKNFALLAPVIQNEPNPNFGFFDGDNADNLKTSLENNRYIQVDYIKGFAMFFNMEEFRTIGFFDKNIFIYLEEIDLCKRLKENQKNIYVISNATITHYGGKSHDEDVNHEMEVSRNWHWMWSSFYFEKKHNGIVAAYLKTFKTFLSALLKFLIIFLLNKKKASYYKARFLGLLNAYLCKPSSYRPKV
ncbi:MAG: glycosyltransferase [Pelagibacterales bacterium]|jgi:N-acetylglucosaminyl-diphospho-decaprenol L-rhamnosyltransferase|nr:glycosyltransferase [Pelagibacterales bacterium]